MIQDLIAEFDIGKTHTRLSTIDARTGAQTWNVRRATRCVDTPIGRQLDIAGIESWLIETLRTAPGREHIRALVPVAHGAAAVLVDDRGEVLAAPDYEDPRFESMNAEYDPQRDPFTETYSPALPLGLNLGRQLFYLEMREPELFARAAHILLYPQFWAWRLSEVMASEVTSLGTHTDLWRPHSLSFSQLALRRTWSARLPQRRFAGDALGTAAGSVARAAGLPADCRIACGIHDSNASYLRHLLHRRKHRFAVISSGTWTVVMANKADLGRLRAERDMLANTDAFGSPVATARFMGGREYEAIARTPAPPTIDALRKVIGQQAMALPAFGAGGPFATCKGRLVRAEPLEDAERAALATLYVALMTDRLIESLDAGGDIILDGPFALNPLFGPLLAMLRPRNRILLDEGQCGAVAIGYLAGFAQQREPTLKAVRPAGIDGLEDYRNAWCEALPQPPVTFSQSGV